MAQAVQRLLQGVHMRTAVMATVLAFKNPLLGGPVPSAARRLAAAMMTWLDRRRDHIDSQP